MEEKEKSKPEEISKIEDTLEVDALDILINNYSDYLSKKRPDFKKMASKKVGNESV